MKAKAANRKGAQVRISEIYGSVQGEGLLTGQASAFVRTSGCNLRCWFCDTPFASWQPEGDYLEIETICQKVESLGLTHVVLTGGEPMIYSRLSELCSQLRAGGPEAGGRHLTIETAGTVFADVPCDLFSISPKLSRSGPAHRPNSHSPAMDLASSWDARHEERREQLPTVRQLMALSEYQLKFVIDQPADTDEVLDYLQRLGEWDGERVLLMPQGVTIPELDAREQWLKPWCEQHQLQYCPRQHIHWYGNRRGT